MAIGTDAGCPRVIHDHIGLQEGSRTGIGMTGVTLRAGRNVIQRFGLSILRRKLAVVTS